MTTSAPTTARDPALVRKRSWPGLLITLIALFAFGLLVWAIAQYLEVHLGPDFDDVVAEGDLAKVKHSLLWGEDPNYDSGPSSQNVLAVAAAHGHLDVMKLLLENGADVNAGEAQGMSALDSAAWSNNREAVTFLLEAGAHVHLVHALYMRDAVWANEIGVRDPKEIEALLNPTRIPSLPGSGYTRLSAARAGINAIGLVQAPEVLAVLLDKGLDPNSSAADMSLLYRAVKDNKPESVRLLLQHDARFRPGTDEYPNALRELELLGKTDLARQLRERFGEQQ